MKVALLTHHWVPNFGANLQALATFSYLRKLGHEVTVLHYVPENLESRYIEICQVSEQIDSHARFCNEYLNISRLLRSSEELASFVSDNEFDCVICGSDAILRLYKNGKSHEGTFPNPFWLDWVRSGSNGRPVKALLSASCTGSNYLTFPSSLKKEICRVLSGIDYISVRDRWTKWMLQFASAMSIKPHLSPDPVVIFNEVFTIPDDHDVSARCPKEPYLLFSAHPSRVSETWVTGFVAAAHKQGFKVFGLPFPEMMMPFKALDGNIDLPLHPLAWYSWIQHSSGFVGERFHPMMVSLVNKVPFVSIDHYRLVGFKGMFKWFNIPHTSKVYSVCSEAGLVNNCIHYPSFMQYEPEAILCKLKKWNESNAAKYGLKSSSVFKKVISDILSVRV